ncbi:MAG: pentapeptide repeat-containing protein [Comamonadaceae bacterium]|nr:MAG: pentapeptide repeat-containing protein [Comamonadaceae bacterium]
MKRINWSGRGVAATSAGAGGLALGYGASLLVPALGSPQFWDIAAQPVATAFAGIGAISAGYLAFQNGQKGRRLDAQHHRENAERDRESDLRDRYTTAAAQLADNHPAIREAGAYAIAALADDWIRFGVASDQSLRARSEQQVCVDLLCSYLRSNRQLVRQTSRADQEPQPPTQSEVEERAVRSSIVDILRGQAGTSLVSSGVGSRPHVRLDGADLARVDLSEADLVNASLIGVNLAHANLHGINLKSADLTDANLRNADLRLGFLRDATLRNADLTSCNMYEVDLSGANLYLAQLSGAHMTGANLNNADLTDTKLIKTQLNGAMLIEVELDGADLSRAFLQNADLTGALLRGADLSDATLVGAELIATNLAEAELVDADLTDADLTFADLTGADLRGANLTRADFTDADLTGADLGTTQDKARYDDTTIWPAGFTPLED